MARVEVEIESARFTRTSELAREILALLESTDYKLRIACTPAEAEELQAELESCKVMGRVKLVTV